MGVDCVRLVIDSSVERGVGCYGSLFAFVMSVTYYRSYAYRIGHNTLTKP